MSDSRPPVLWTWRLLLVRLRRIAWPVLVAFALWLAWSLAALAMRDEEQGPFIALLLLGLCVVFSAALAGLGWYLVTRRLRARDAAELAQLIWLNQAMQPRQPLPPLGTWAASPDLLVGLWRIIRDKRPARVLEIGSGLSTLVMACALEQNQQGGELVALEDHPHFANQTRRQLAEHGLEGRARVLDAPLQTQHVAGRHGLWYTLSSLDGLTDVDLLLVDGPGMRDRSMALFCCTGCLPRRPTSWLTTPTGRKPAACWNSGRMPSPDSFARQRRGGRNGPCCAGGVLRGMALLREQTRRQRAPERGT